MLLLMPPPSLLPLVLVSPITYHSRVSGFYLFWEFQTEREDKTQKEKVNMLHAMFFQSIPNMRRNFQAVIFSDFLNPRIASKICKDHGFHGIQGKVGPN